MNFNTIPEEIKNSIITALVTTFVIGFVYEYFIKINLEVKKELMLVDKQNGAKIISTLQLIGKNLGLLKQLNKQFHKIPDTEYSPFRSSALNSLQNNFNDLEELVSQINFRDIEDEKSSKWLKLTFYWIGISKVKLSNFIKSANEEKCYDLNKYIEMCHEISAFWAAKYSYNGIFIDLIRKVIYFNFTQKQTYSELAKELNI